MAGQPHGVFFFSCLLNHCVCITIILGVGRPPSSQFCFALRNLLCVLPFAFFSLVQRASNLQPFQIKLLA